MSSAPDIAAPPAAPDLPVSALDPALDNGAAKPARTLGPLRMIWRETAKYPRQVVFALIALVITASATLAIPAGFHLIIDRGFARGGDPAEIGRWFRYLLLIVAVLGLGTAVRFYFVSWLGERVVADIRLKVQANLMRQSPAFFEANSPNEISSRMTSDTTLVEQVVGTTASVALRNTIMGLGGIMVVYPPDAAFKFGKPGQDLMLRGLHLCQRQISSCLRFMDVGDGRRSHLVVAAGQFQLGFNRRALAFGDAQ